MIEVEAEQLISLHNDYRQSIGKELLLPNVVLMQQAQEHAEWMFNKRTMSHGSWWSGNTLTTRIKRSGYKYRGIAENVAAGQTTPEQVFRAWINSRGHRNNIRGNYNEIGVGRLGNYWCVIFGKR